MTEYSDLVLAAATLANILGKGKEIQRGEEGRSWLTCCPVPEHDDQNPSLTIDVGQEITFKCLSRGCEDEEIRAAIEAIPFTIPMITRRKGGGNVAYNKIAHADEIEEEWFIASQWGRIPDVVYTYRNERGQAVFFVCRIEADPPDFLKKVIKAVVSARPRTGKGEPFWVIRAYDPNFGRPLYNLPELVARPDAPVLIVEGEKTADAAKELVPSHVVMTWAGGAGAIKQSQWGVLQNRDVVLWPDNDEVGIKAMAGVAALIGRGSKAARSLKQVFTAVDSGFPLKWDLADFYEDLNVDLMLAEATEVDTSKLREAILPADEEEQEAKLEYFVNKYVVLYLGDNFKFVDLPTGSPFSRQSIPYLCLSKASLEMRELEAYLTPRGMPRRFIRDYLESPKKRSVSGYVYDPSTTEQIVVDPSGQKLLNLYRGLAHLPKPCDPSLYRPFLDHINASCPPIEAKYLIHWFAAKVQLPQRMLGTMIVLAGRQGCGKTIVCDIMRAILGPHNSVKIGLSDLTGQFNSQYANKLFIDVEEYNPINNKTQRELREKVKNLITAETIMVNTKGLPAYEQSCFHNIIATTNSLTPEAIGYDNRRMNFFEFDNKSLRRDGAVIRDPDYFAKLIAVKESPEALAGLCDYLAKLEIDWDLITKPLDSELIEEAKAFVDDSVFAFLKSLADTATLPETDTWPDDSKNSFAISRWPKQACTVPRAWLSQMVRDYCNDIRHENISPDKAGRLLMKALHRPRGRGASRTYQYPRGIPETYVIEKNRRWDMLNARGDTFEKYDRAFCLPDIDELRALVATMAGAPIEWSDIAVEDDPGTGVVVDFPGKTEPESDPDQF